MKNQKFGVYLRKLRTEKQPPMSQEMLANAIGRSKMTVSQFEIGKNAPPQGELLTRIVDALELTPEQENELRFLAAEERKAIPSEIEDYFYKNPSVCEAIRAAKDAGCGDEFWAELAQKIANNEILER